MLYIEDGENEDELWRVFEKFLEILDDVDSKDELYFDITHLFRSVCCYELYNGRTCSN